MHKDFSPLLKISCIKDVEPEPETMKSLLVILTLKQLHVFILGLY